MVLESSKDFWSVLVVSEWNVPQEFNSYYLRFLETMGNNSVNIVPIGRREGFVTACWNWPSTWMREMTGWIRTWRDSVDY
jgi:hypothetical protein